MIYCKGRTRVILFAAVALCGLCFTLHIYGLPEPAGSASSSGQNQQAQQPQLPSAAGAPSAQAISDAWALFNAGQIDQAEAAFQHILGDAAGSQDSSGEAEAHIGLSSIAYRRAKFADARTEDERALALFDALHDRR